MMLNVIPYQNAKNGKIYKKNKKELSKIVLKHKNYKIKFKKFKLHIILLSGYYAGYILDFHKNPLVKKYFTKNEIENISKIKGAYKIHGGFTHKEGFDCAHINDIQVGFTKKFKGKTFKTHKFVESELKKFVNSIIKISNKRNKKTTKTMKGGSTYDIRGTPDIKYCTEWGGEDYLYNTRTKESKKITEFLDIPTIRLRDYMRQQYPKLKKIETKNIFSVDRDYKEMINNDEKLKRIIQEAERMQDYRTSHMNNPGLLDVSIEVAPGRTPPSWSPELLNFNTDIIKEFITAFNFSTPIFELFRTEEFKEYSSIMIKNQISFGNKVSGLLASSLQAVMDYINRSLLKKGIENLQKMFNDTFDEHIQMYLSNQGCELYFTFKHNFEMIGLTLIRINDYWKISFSLFSFMSTIFEKSLNCQSGSCKKKILDEINRKKNALLNKFAEILNKYKKDYLFSLYLIENNTIANFSKSADIIIASNERYQLKMSTYRL
jgi:hypothetical protein